MGGLTVAVMKFEAADADYAARVRASFQRQAAMAHIGAQLTHIAPGEVDICLPFASTLTQQHGFFHAGITSTIADSAGGYAAFSLMRADASVLTVEFKVNLLAPADGEQLIAYGRVKRAGKQLTVAEVEVVVHKGAQRKTCAIMLQTLMTMHGRTEGEQRMGGDH